MKANVKTSTFLLESIWGIFSAFIQSHALFAIAKFIVYLKGTKALIVFIFFVPNKNGSFNTFFAWLSCGCFMKILMAQFKQNVGVSLGKKFSRIIILVN